MVLPRQGWSPAPPDIGNLDDEAIKQEAAKIRVRAQLDEIAQRIGGPGTRVKDPDLFTRFLQSAGQAFQRQSAPADAGLLDRLLPGFRQLATPTLPEQIVTRAPGPLQPAARVVREVSSPLGLATLPIGGSARVVAGGLAGAMGGATAGQAVGGNTGEIIGAIGGGVAGGTPAVQRLAGRGATAAGKGVMRITEPPARLPQSSAEIATRGAPPPIQPPRPSGQVPPQGGGPTPPVDPIKKITSVIQTAKAGQIETQALRQQYRKDQYGRMVAAARGAPSSEEAVSAVTKELAGKQPIADFAVPEGLITEVDRTQLFDRLAQARDRQLLNVYEFRNAGDAMKKMLDVGVLPRDFEIEYFERVYGPEFAQALVDARKKGPDYFARVFTEVMGAPKTLLSGPDVSAPLRQGVLLIPSHPVESLKHTGKMFTALLSNRKFIQYDAAIKADPDFGLLTQQAKLYYADPMAAVAKLSKREEAYISHLVQDLPDMKGIRDFAPARTLAKIVTGPYRASERAWTTYLNGIRFRVMKNTIEQWRSAGLLPKVGESGEVNVEALQRMAGFLNHATGRGKLAGKTDTLLNYAAIPLWSPRLLVSRFQVLSDYGRALATIGRDELAAKHIISQARADPLVRAAANQIARDVTAFMMTGATIIGLMTAAKRANLPGFKEIAIEADPRSSDFGRARVGNTRVDLWGGFQPLVRYGAQAVTRQRKVLSGKRAGSIQDTRAWNVLDRLLWSKVSPGVPSLFETGIHGETFLGDEVELSETAQRKARRGEQASAGEVWRKEFLSQFSPLVAQDLAETVQSLGPEGMALMPISVLGGGVQTFGSREDAPPSGYVPKRIPLR